jgi:hypothetical protein
MNQSFYSKASLSLKNICVNVSLFLLLKVNEKSEALLVSMVTKDSLDFLSLNEFIFTPLETVT